MYYYDDEEDYQNDDEEYNYSDDYFKINDSPSDSPGVLDFMQGALVTPTKRITTTTTPTTSTTTTTTTAKTIESSRKSTPQGKKSYNPGGYNRYESSKDADKQYPKLYNSGQIKSTAAPKDIACNSPQMLKTFLKSGAHGNDPRKIKAMIMKCQLDKDKAKNEQALNGSEDNDNDNAKSIFEKYALKKNKPSSKKDTKNSFKNDPLHKIEDKLPPKSFLPSGYNGFEPTKKVYNMKDANKKMGTSMSKVTGEDEEEYEDDDEYYDDDYDDYENNESDDKDAFKPYGGVSRPKETGTGTSSNLFKKFLKHNAGKTVRRPTNTNDEESEVASNIFKKYSSGIFKRPPGGYNKV